MYVYLKIQVFTYTVIKICLIPFNYIEQQLWSALGDLPITLTYEAKFR